ncbi:redoxin domain-containing protein [Pseudoxanthomonas dokdonensis]|uniref:Nhl repeat protein n=1 Tax=Pseudoxanthomonas dokdonensis TaxID=344882 RepID=A0A0R0D0U7_9GAMM|nr:redoxin domain-containing protein [Pseudoxanthomonas dokdonensis]KRG71203.1 nhl repeat protein [Pseudoxanthomonas dokdonensis]
MTDTMAPELPQGLAWLNAPGGSLHEQRGRIVALAFVNAASAWCGQRLAELALLQSRYLGRLQTLVISVPRFDSERVPQRVLKQLRRQGVRFPIAHDSDWQAWQQYGITAWPTVLLIDAEGQVRHRLVGVDGLPELERGVAALCDGLQPATDDDMRIPREANPEPRLPLLFPSGLVATAERLFVADSGHHRVLECTHAGRVIRQFGMGAADFIDGDLGQAAFNNPQGLALARESLYVADAGNHALRRINLPTRMVDTLCGNGRAGRPTEGVVNHPRDVALNQPLAVAEVNNQVYLAMSGDNSIWSYGLGNRELRHRAGAGALDVRDGHARLAAFAQPVSLAPVQQVLYVCDALGSAIRCLQLNSDTVQTVTGKGPWEFGAQDGPRESARLQHPQGIALQPGSPQMWIADTGNGSLRSLRLGGGELKTIELPRPLHSPTGLAVAAGAVWIAETDAHAIVRYDIASGELSHVPIEE